jgi:hypothetical protein
MEFFIFIAVCGSFQPPTAVQMNLLNVKFYHVNFLHQIQLHPYYMHSFGKFLVITELLTNILTNGTQEGYKRNILTLINMSCIL